MKMPLPATTSLFADGKHDDIPRGRRPGHSLPLRRKPIRAPPIPILPSSEPPTRRATASHTSSSTTKKGEQIYRYGDA